MGNLQRIPRGDMQAAFGKLERALDRAQGLADIARVHDAAEVYRIACLKAKRGIEIQNQMAEVRLRAERKAGALLAKLPRSNGGRPGRTKNAVRRGPSFKEAIDGIVKPQTAKRWQSTAKIKEAVFEQVIREVKASASTGKPKELTSAALGRAWAKVNPNKSNVITMSPDGRETTDTNVLKHETDAWELAMLNSDTARKMRWLRDYLKVKGMTDAVVELVNRAYAAGEAGAL